MQLQVPSTFTFFFLMAFLVLFLDCPAEYAVTQAMELWVFLLLDGKFWGWFFLYSSELASRLSFMRAFQMHQYLMPTAVNWGSIYIFFIPPHPHIHNPLFPSRAQKLVLSTI